MIAAEQWSRKGVALTDKTQARKDFLINLLYFAAILAGIIFVARFALRALAPFIVAFIVAAILVPLVRLLYFKVHLPKKLTGVVLVILFYGTIGVLLSVIEIKLYEFIRGFIADFPTYWVNYINPAILSISSWLGEIMERFHIKTEAVGVRPSDLISTLTGAITSISSWVVGKMSSAALSVPEVIVKTIIGIVSTVLIVIDWDQTRNFLIKQLPERAATVAVSAWRTLCRMIFKFIKSYGFIMIITFVELTVGFLIIGVKKAPVVAVCIAVFDLLPIVGSGTVLIPWGIISLIRGDIRIGVGVLILYVIILIIRQIIEPKIVGDQVGLQPIVTLIGMVAGTAIFGGLGLIGLPVAVAVIKKMDDDGVINILKKDEKDIKAAEERRAAEAEKRGLRDLFGKRDRSAGKNRNQEANTQLQPQPQSSSQKPRHQKKQEPVKEPEKDRE
jgi:sporulation integral membrane protein YtvI